MSTSRRSLRACAQAIALCVALLQSFSCEAGETDRYRYTLMRNKAPEVCRHMLGVYNKHMQTPWLPNAYSAEAFAEHSKYAYPKLPGVAHDSKMTFDMRYSRLPTSREFDALDWREGRYLLTGGDGKTTERPMLVTEADIDHDGDIDVLVKISFMARYTHNAGRDGTYGGQDSIYVLSKRHYERIMADTSALPNLAEFVKGAAVLLMFGETIRPFILNGVVLIATYEQIWKNRANAKLNPDAEQIRILKYKRGTAFPGPGQSDIDAEALCRFGMHVIK
jgi:hypothetical protein